MKELSQTYILHTHSEGSLGMVQVLRNGSHETSFVSILLFLPTLSLSYLIKTKDQDLIQNAD